MEFRIQCHSTPSAFQPGHHIFPSFNFGEEGSTGATGVGITGATIVNGELILIYTDGTDENVGNVIGPTGAKGKDGYSANTGATGPTGSGISSTKIDEYGNLIITYTGASGYTENVGNVIGPTGPEGIQGIQGIQGPQGPRGLSGAQGPIGDQGIQGIQGPQGPRGLSGAQGPIGDQGIQGIQGVQGIQGIKGDQGDQGDQGIQGPTGPNGIVGVRLTKTSRLTIPIKNSIRITSYDVINYLQNSSNFQINLTEGWIRVLSSGLYAINGSCFFKKQFSKEDISPVTYTFPATWAIGEVTTAIIVDTVPPNPIVGFSGIYAGACQGTPDYNSAQAVCNASCKLYLQENDYIGLMGYSNNEEAQLCTDTWGVDSYVNYTKTEISVVKLNSESPNFE